MGKKKPDAVNAGSLTLRFCNQAAHTNRSRLVDTESSPIHQGNLSSIHQGNLSPIHQGNL